VPPANSALIRVFPRFSAVSTTGSSTPAPPCRSRQSVPVSVSPVYALIKCRVMKYRVYLEQDEDGVFVATCPALPGCVSQGQTRSEATENIREAIEGYLKSLKKHGDPVPPSILEEVIEVTSG